LGLWIILGLGWFAAAEVRPIRLRSGTFLPESKTFGAKLLNPEPAVSGLFLLQFQSTPDLAVRESLKQAGIDLLWYVPEAAFVARCDSARLRDWQQNGVLSWFGPYQPQHKVPRELTDGLAAALPDQWQTVRVLTVPLLKKSEYDRLVQVFRKSDQPQHNRFGSIIHGTVDARRLAALQASPLVVWVEKAPRMKLVDEVSTKIVSGGTGAGSLPEVHALGYDGRGVVVAVADSGLHFGDAESMHADLAGRVDGFFYYGNLTDAADEHSHGTHVTGIIAGNAALGETDDNGFLYGLGVAPGARIVAQRLFDGVGNYEPPPTFETMTRDATRAGAVIGSNSWGDDTQGRYDLSAVEFDALVRDADALKPGDQPYILEFSAGNAGPGSQTIGSPAVAKNVIATGASQSEREDFFIYGDGRETMADFSSRGPCEDGRIKPDVVAPGTWIASLQSGAATDENSWAPISANYQYQGGTSQAGPHVSGAAAIFVQYYRERITNQVPSPALVKAALINSAADMDDAIETEAAPNADEGWGRVDLPALLAGPRRHEFIDQQYALTNGQVFERRMVVANREEPIKVTLAYTDVPGLPAAIPALVNDLDLEVQAPDGHVYRGNQFLEGESIPDAPGFDRLNNVEGVLISEPLPGEYRIRVHAHLVVQDALIATPAIDQDFALVTSANVPFPGEGILFLDRTSYMSNAPLNLKLIDPDLAGLAQVTVQMSSTTEAVGETVTLHSESLAEGSFTGRVALVGGPSQPDGLLQVRHGDQIQASYLDASPAGWRTAEARADFLPPVITGLTVTNQFGQMVIRWQTDETARHMVYYASNGVPVLVAPGDAAGTGAEVVLAGLAARQTYRFYLVSEDEAGNRATNDNAGAFFTLVAVPAAPVLLVDGYFAFSGDDSPAIPRTVYTDALAGSGIAYEVWDTSLRGSPALRDLQPYRSVIWRVNDSLWGGLLGYQGLTLSEQTTLQQYVNSGGGLFLASMEILSRLGSSSTALAFRTNVLQVASFAEDAGVEVAEGVPGDPVARQLDFAVDYTNYESDFLSLIVTTFNVSDTLSLMPGAAPIFLDADSGRTVGLRYPRTGVDSTGRVVFLSFPFDGISAPERQQLLRQALQFLVPGINGLGVVTLDRSAYAVPGNLVVEVADSDLEGQGECLAEVSVTDTTNRVVLTLTETGRKGVFRGTLPVLSATSHPAAGSLVATHGQTLVAQYYEASSHSWVQTEAVIDTAPTLITGVVAETDYEETVVSWTTSEATDALVQFGESRLLGRTAYLPDRTTDHALLLAGLDPDRTYFYQVVSRDEAGNTTVDDNQGQLYVFQTLRPMGLPFRDAFDTGTLGWTVFGGEDSQRSWTLGVPANGQEYAAHSAPNAWGSNLEGTSADYIDSFLISPAIDLRGGNHAKLTFWHSYDFQERSEMDLIEGGVVYVITNRVTDPVELGTYLSISDGWEPAELDLTPYLGRVVYLVWHHQLLSFDSLPRPGWLVDDVQITVTNIVGGTIVISNNLAQSRFVLTGPQGRSGQGWLVLSNAVPGEYRVAYADVPYYQAPAWQTNVLAAGGMLTFAGNYTLLDTNLNLLADAWEQEYFPGQTVAAHADSDGDGASNRAEFLAGTNPTNAASVLRVQMAAPLFSVGTVPGHAYRFWGSTNLPGWQPLTDWTIAPGSTLSLPASNAPASRAWLIRVEARP
jgi:hypothetical protein